MARLNRKGKPCGVEGKEEGLGLSLPTGPPDWSGLLGCRYPLVNDLRKMLEDAWSSPILPVTSLESSGTSCLKSRGAEGRLPGPATPAGTGAA